MKIFRLGKLFAQLPIRSKLIVLHNCFFLMLALSLYFALHAPLTQVALRSAAQEAEILTQLFETEPGALKRINSDHFTFSEGSAQQLNIPAETQTRLKQSESKVWREPSSSQLPESFRLIRFDPASANWQTITINTHHYEELVQRLQLMLGIALAGIYLLAVMALELFILPHYVYHPIRRILRADEALQQGVREHELITTQYISGDELGQIMASRNATISLLREQEHQLKDALTQLEELTNDLRRKNHLLETAKQNLASQERLASLGLMSAGVAHEINTPLAVLHGSIEKMIEAPTDIANTERLQRLLRVTERLRGISESLTDFARARTQTMSEVKVRPILEEAWSLVKMDLRPINVSFINESTESDAVIGNAGRLLQVFVNLFKNGIDAIKSANTNGKHPAELKVSTRHISADQRTWLVVAVEDSGSGIRPDILPRIFEPFVTSRLDARGTGLGLAVTEGIIHQHGGVIVASNRSEGGARFEITLPAPEKSSKANGQQ